LFANVLIAPQLRHFHHFGAPAYVLNNNLQQGQKARKWEQRARIGVYLGQSMQHACTIMLVLPLHSGNISPQFHCQVDDSFASVMGKNSSLVPTSEWQYKAKLRVTNIKSREQQVLLPSVPIPAIPLIPTPPPEQTIAEQMEAVDIQPPEGIQFAPDDPILPPTLFESALEAAQHLPENPLLAFKAVRQSNPDTMYLWQAMKQPDWAQFKQTMQEEVNAHTINGHWKLIKRSDLPKGATILPAVWSLKGKRRISTREIYKWKARLTVDGLYLLLQERSSPYYA